MSPSCAGSRERHRRLRVARGFTRARGSQLAGRFAREHLPAVISDHAAAATFVCGPPALIEAVRAVWARGRPARARGRDVHRARAELRHRRRRGRRPLRRQRTRGRQQRPAAARAGRGRRPGARARLPHGHLQHVQLPARRRARCATSSPARSPAPARSRSVSACRCPSATSRLRSRPPTPEKEPAMPTTAPNLTPEQLEAFGEELDAIRARVVADLGERDVDYINRVIRVQRGLEVAGRGLLFARLPAARLARRHRRAVAVEDPRQHGDRPQRHARPVRLDGGPAAERQDASSGTPPAPPTSGATRTTTCTTRTRTSSARTATSATASCACPRSSRGARTTSATRCTRRCWRPSSSTGWRCTTSRPSGSPPAR